MLCCQPNHGQFTLRQLFRLTLACALLALLARWHWWIAYMFAPLLLGGFVAHAVVPSAQSAAVGIAAAHYWSIVAILPALFLAWALNFYLGIDVAASMLLLSAPASILGGHVGGQIERSRLRADRRVTGLL